MFGGLLMRVTNYLEANLMHMWDIKAVVSQADDNYWRCIRRVVESLILLTVADVQAGVVEEQ